MDRSDYTPIVTDTTHSVPRSVVARRRLGWSRTGLSLSLLLVMPAGVSLSETFAESGNPLQRVAPPLLQSPTGSGGLPFPDAEPTTVEGLSGPSGGMGPKPVSKSLGSAPSIQDVIQQRQLRHGKTVQTQYQQPNGNGSSGNNGQGNFNQGNTNQNQGNNGQGNNGQGQPFGTYNNNGQQFQTVASKPEPRKKPGFFERLIKGDPGENAKQPPAPPAYTYPTQSQQRSQQQGWNNNGQQQQYNQQQQPNNQQPNNQQQQNQFAQQQPNQSNQQQQFNQQQQQPQPFAQQPQNQAQYNGPSANQFQGVSPPAQGLPVLPNNFQQRPNGKTPYYPPTNVFAPPGTHQPLVPRKAPPPDFSRNGQPANSFAPQGQFEMPISTPQGQVPSTLPSYSTSDGGSPYVMPAPSGGAPQLPGMNSNAPAMEEGSLLDDFFPNGSEQTADVGGSPYQQPPQGLSSPPQFEQPLPPGDPRPTPPSLGLPKLNEAPTTQKPVLELKPKKTRTVEPERTPEIPAPAPEARPRTPAAAPPSAESRAAGNRTRLAERHGRKGLMGFCPVALRDERDLVEVHSEFISEYNGKTYYFSSAHARAVFDETPAKYAPAASGLDAVILSTTGEEREGTLEHASWYKGKLYLFSDDQRMNEFLTNPGQFAITD